MRHFGIPFFVLTLAIGAHSADGQDRPLTSLVPADSLVVYTAKPYALLAPPASQPTTARVAESNAISSITTIISFLNASGLIPDEGQVFADVAAALPLLGQFEHGLVLLDATSRVVETGDPADEVSLRLDQLQAAVILRTSGRQRVVLEVLNRIIGRYTNNEVAKLTNLKIGNREYQRLVDRRMPGWAVWEFGLIDDCYVVCFGEGAYAKVVEAQANKGRSLADGEWFKRAGKQVHADSSMAHWYIAFSRIRERLGIATQHRVDRVTKSLGAEDISSDMWAIGREGRALSLTRCYRRGGEDILQTFSDPSKYPADLRAIIPSKAENMAIITVPTKWLVDDVPRAWLAAQSEDKVEFWRRVWEQVERDAAVDIDGSLISQLGDRVLLFDYPPHPLKVPFALTVAIEIHDADAVSAAINALLESWGRYLDERAERLKVTLVRLKVKRSDDGIWYFQAGILGPALKVTDRFIVISWSPEALRDALTQIDKARK